MKKFVVLILSVLCFSFSYSNTDRQIWFGFVHQARLVNHWGYWLEFHHRTKNEFSNNLHLELVRVGGTYFINNQWRLTVGYAFIPQFPSLTNQSFVRLEHRPWQQVFHTVTKKSFRVTQYLRNEQRLFQKTSGEKIMDGYLFRERVRYNLMVHFLFNKDKAFKQNSFGVVFANEVLVNAYSSDKVNWFDQNRASAGLFYNLTNALQLQLGYLNVFARTTKGDDVIHAIRLFAFYTLDLRKK